ncbi:hypothetical protein ALO76_02886 [Pseudomonas syringae pv. coriandricola]|uniref:hypothetical protein n=1 Tax=Pseudomonas syringae group TaxID=136849 RepID=UPI0006B8F47C|nr:MULTISPECIES: hypothetical protein [Pseudomonas syringae group]KPW79238.1 hypothetical protein ALO76_02886 [Pseudomonas syringae pv. coriandricola]
MNCLKKTIDAHRQWLFKSSDLVTEELNYVYEDIESNSLVGFNNVADSLGILASYYGTKGEVAIYDEDNSGWQDISKSVMYRYWALKLKAKSFSNTRFLKNVKTVPNLTNQMSNAACLLATFISTNQRVLSSNVADILMGMITVKDAVDQSYFEDRRFEPFMLWLNSIYAGSDVPSQVTNRDFGVYQAVVNNWENEQNLSSSLEAICVYHLANSEDKGGKWNPEFKKPPFDLLPFELSAIYQVRQNVGLETPTEIRHNLLPIKKTDLEKINFNSDDILEKINAAYEDFFG